MKHFYFLIFIVGLALNTFSQNLVLNPSFESTIGVPPCSWLTTNLSGSMNNWSAPTSATPDIFSTTVATTCWASATGSGSGYGPQLPRTGNIMTGATFYRVASSGCSPSPWYEYVQGQLSTPLTVGQTYYGEFYVSAADVAQYQCNGQGMYFSTSNVSTGCTYLVAPTYTPAFSSTAVITNTSGWTQVSGTFVAAAAYTRIIIGNFRSSATTTIVNNPIGAANANAYYFIDDALVTPVTTLPTQSVSLKGNAQGLTHQLAWNIDNNLTIQELYLEQASPSNPEQFNTISKYAFGGENSFSTSITQKGDHFYRLRMVDRDGKMYLSEVVTLGYNSSQALTLFPIYPNPANGQENINIPFMVNSIQDNVVLSVYDMTGKQIVTQTLTETEKQSAKTTLNYPFTAGLYLIQLSNGKQNVQQKLTVF